MKEYNLQINIINIFTVDTFATIGMKDFVWSAVFTWIVYQRTDKKTKIHTLNKNITSISEISFCLN